MHEEPYHATSEALLARAAHTRTLQLLYDISGYALVEQAKLLEEALRACH
jgi:hypothetical protein